MLGRRAAELLVQMMTGQAPEEQRTTVPVKLVRRESTRTAR